VLKEAARNGTWWTVKIDTGGQGTNSLLQVDGIPHVYVMGKDRESKEGWQSSLRERGR